MMIINILFGFFMLVTILAFFTVFKMMEVLKHMIEITQIRLESMWEDMRQRADKW